MENVRKRRRVDLIRLTQKDETIFDHIKKWNKLGKSLILEQLKKWFNIGDGVPDDSENITENEKLRKLIASPKYISSKDFGNNLVAVHSHKGVINLNIPTYT